MRRSTLVATAGLLMAVLISIYLVRPPGPGQVYRFRSDQYGLSESTALLLRNGDCLVLSRSEEDIGKTQADPGSEHRLFIIAGSQRVRSVRGENGPYLRDMRNGLIARPGDAIDAEIVFPRDAGGLADTLAVGWPLDFGCGQDLAKLFSISRVHR